MPIDVNSHSDFFKQLIVSEDHFKETFDHISSVVVLFEVLNNGTSFIIKDLNKAGELLSKKEKKEVVGQNLADVFPGIIKLGFPEIFQKIWKTGKCEWFPRVYKKDDLIPGWGENYVFKLPSGDIVAIFNGITERIDNQRKLQQLNEKIETVVDERTSNLKDSENKFKLIVENANDLITILNKDFEMEYVNDHYKKVLGYAPEELLGKLSLSLVHPDDIKIAIKTTYKGTKTGKESVDLRFKHKNGHYVWCEMKGTYFKDNKGNLKSLVISRDISERKKSEQLIIESEKKYRNLLNNLSDIIVESDSKMHLTFISLNCKEVLGYSPEELFGTYLLSYVHPDDLERCLNELKISIQSKKSRIAEFRLLHKNGNYLYFSIKGTFIEEKGHGKFIVSLRDITEKKIAENKLIESEEKYRMISEDTDDLIVILNENYGIDYYNQITHSRVLGYKPYKFAKFSFRCSTVHKEDLEKLVTSFKEGFKRGELKDQYRIRHVNGKYLWFEIRGKVFVDKQSGKKMLCVLSDITEIKKVEEKLKELSELKSELLRRASHELKTPLVSVYGASQLLLNTYQDHLDDITKELIEIIKNGGERLKMLVENLLDASQLETKVIKLKLTNEDLTKIIKNCINELKFFANERELSINFNSSGEYHLNIDKLRFEQVIFNLLTNAIKFTPKRGKIFVSIEESPDDCIEIKIKDTGIGFTEEEKSMIFKEFGKIEHYGQGLDINPEGTGIGLFISKRIINLHRGTIYMESEGRNKGSTFIIRLTKK